MISPSIAYTFIDANVAILANSGINFNVSRIKATVENGTFTKKYFLSFISHEISHFFYNWFYNASTCKSFDYRLLIINVRKSGKDFKYTFLKDIEPFKSRELKSIEQGNHDTLIFTFTDGELYRMYFPLNIGNFRKSNILISRLDNLPKEYDAKELKEIILNILKPIIEFQHESEDMTSFMKREYLKYIPFEDHSWISRRDESQVKNWEYCIERGPWKLSRDTVKTILNIFISALRKYADDTTAPKGWCETVNNAIHLIKSL